MANNVETAMRMEGFPLPPTPKCYGRKEIQSKLCTIKFMHHMHFYIYNCLASVIFYFRDIVSVLLKGTSVGLPFLQCQHKTAVPRLQDLFSEISQNNIYVPHIHKYRCVSCISTSDNGSLSWMEVTETKERNRFYNPVLFSSCN